MSTPSTNGHKYAVEPTLSWVVTDTECPYCRSDDHLAANETNFPHAHYCTDCNQPFNPGKWPCPGCDDRWPVTRNPLDPLREYYCHECELAFNRLGPSFDSDSIADRSVTGELDGQTREVTFEVKEQSDEPPIEVAFELRNDSSVPVDVLGKTAVAVQFHVADNDWWTLLGNPDAYDQPASSELRPGEALTSTLRFHPTGIEVLATNEFLLQDPLPSGEYRIVYWGLPLLDEVVAERLLLEFDHGW